MQQIKLLYQYPYLQPNKLGKLECKVLDVIELSQNKVSLTQPIIALSDMQGLVEQGGKYFPLGVDVFDNLLPILSLERIIPDITGCPCIIAGDMYASTTDFRMGLSGPIDDVLEAISGCGFQSVSIVLCNHDELNESSIDDANASKALRVLDGTIHKTGGLSVGGISGVMGNPRKQNRNDPKMFAHKLKKVHKESNILLLHEGPAINQSQIGNEFIREQILGLQNKLVISGHAHWRTPTAFLGSNLIINTDARIVVIR